MHYEKQSRLECVMKNHKKGNSQNLDYYDYSEFDDDYYNDLAEEKAEKRSKRKRPPRRSSGNANAFHNYMKDY